MTPAQADSSNIGPNWHAASKPTATPLPVRCRTSSVSAIIVSQLPLLEISCPTKNSRKLRTHSDANVRRLQEPGPAVAVDGTTSSSTAPVTRPRYVVGLDGDTRQRSPGGFKDVGMLW